jgi:hypothetical protein
MIRRPLAALAALAAAAAIILAALPALGSTYVAAGMSGQYNKPMCESNAFERVKTAATEYAAVDSAGTCISSEKYHAAFTITSVRNMSYQFPMISSGFVPTGEPTCASAKDTCYAYPVRQEYDGTPVATFGAWLNPGQYKLAFDTWFSPVKSRHDYDERSGDVEIMAWLVHPGESIAPSQYLYYATIDHIRFGVDSWEQASGVRYVAFVALSGPGSGRTETANGQRVSYSNLWLNPIFRSAIAHGLLKKTDWLWAIDLGFELTRGGKGGNIHGYTLSGLPS